MTKATAISSADIENRLTSLPGWSFQDNSLVKTHDFSSYVAALDFVYALGHEAEEADHHPEINLNYKKATIRWSTHSAGGVTDADFQMARRSQVLIDEVSAEAGKN
jgi:4a-hydroxytetrahydrobiopterin dehydratase